jgi:hypothetical protein
VEPRFIASTRSAILAGLRLERSRTKAPPGRLAVAAQRRGMPLDFIPPAPITPLAGEFDQLVDRLLVTVFGPFSQIGQIASVMTHNTIQWLRPGSVGPWRVLVGFHQC